MHRAATFRRFLPLLVATLIAAALVPFSADAQAVQSRASCGSLVWPEEGVQWPCRPRSGSPILENGPLIPEAAASNAASK
jgi:hypothetical protein